jgi:nucleoside-diphosphate-sugar epimerase
MKVLVTGANGFVGKALCRELTGKDHRVCCAYRSSPHGIDKNAISVGSIDGKTEWQNALNDVEVVVQLAARVHVMSETASDSLAAFREVNVDGTLNLARQAVAAKVRRFVYLSSIKVNGEKTGLNAEGKGLRGGGGGRRLL